jgi:hypothetical protein
MQKEDGYKRSRTDRNTNHDYQGIYEMKRETQVWEETLTISS